MRAISTGISGFALLSIGLHALAFGSVYLIVDGMHQDAPVREVSQKISLGLKASQAGSKAVTEQTETKEAVKKTLPKPVEQPKPKPQKLAKRPQPEPIAELPPKPAEKPAEPPIQKAEEKPAQDAPVPVSAAPETSGHQGKIGTQTAPNAKVETGDANEDGARASEASYDLLVMRQLKAEKRYPSLAKRRKQEGGVQLSFCIDRNGHLMHDEAIRVSSEWKALEDAVRDQLERAAPFPPAPEDVRWQRRPYTVTINFSLKDG